MRKLPPSPPLPPSPSGVTQEQIKKAVDFLFMASAARIGRHLNFIGQDEIGLIWAELERMAETGELRKNWINNQVLFSLAENS